MAKLHAPMAAEYKKRVEALDFYNEISGVDYGRRDPAEYGDDMTAEGEYAGYDKTAPVISEFVDSFGCRADGKNLYRKGGKTNIWALFPGSVPLWTEEGNHVDDWKAYWNWLIELSKGWPTRERDFRFSVGTYGSATRFTPRGYKYRANTPWNRMARYYLKPQMNAAKPTLMNAVRSALTYLPRYGVSTAAAGDNCVMFFFFQDVPKDLNDFMVPEQFEMITELHSICSIIPIVVGPEARSERWKKFIANFVPGMRTKFSKDPDYSGAFYVNDFAGLADAQFNAHLNIYQCLLENRALCRTVQDAWVPPGSEGPTVVEPTEGFRAIEEDYVEPTAPPTDEVASEGTTEAPTTATDGTTATEGTTPKVPEIDSCCGHEGWSGTPFDSELRTCCEDGQVRAYEFEGEDPCLAAADDFYFDNYDYKK